MSTLQVLMTLPVSMAIFSFILWTLATWGLGIVIFRSLPANAFMTHLRERYKDKETLFKRVQWEVNTGKEYHAEAVRLRNPDLSTPLTQEQLEEKKKTLAGLRKLATWLDVVRYPFGCEFCQSAWAAIILMLLTTPLSAKFFFTELPPAAMAYAMTATIFSSLLVKLTSKGAATKSSCSG